MDENAIKAKYKTQIKTKQNTKKKVEICFGEMQ